MIADTFPWGRRWSSGVCRYRMLVSPAAIPIAQLDPARTRVRRRGAAALAGTVVAVLVLGGPAPVEAARYVSGEVVVKFAKGTSRDARAAAARTSGVARPDAFASRTRLLRVRRGQTVTGAIRALRARRDVVYAVPNYIARASTIIPNDPGRGSTPGGWQDIQWNFLAKWGVNAPDAWQNLVNAGAPGGKGVKVAVLDTGVAYSNRGRFRRSPDLERARFVRGYDFVDRRLYPVDHNGHGTHVASTIAEATNNQIALTGLAYGAKIMPIRVLDSHGEGDATVIAKGVRFAVRRGAHVINLSLEFPSDVRSSEIPELIEALNYAQRRGVFVVAASGNEAHASIAYPARARGVVSVGATTEHGCLSDFSNDGRGLDLVAPGGGADAQLNGDPNCNPLSTAGRDIYQLTFLGSSPRRFGLPSGYEGTSMATPHVAATAALIIASGVIGPRPTPRAIENRLKQTARDLGPRGADTLYGWGLIDAAAATAPPGPPPPPPA
jgi:serine protease